MKTILEHLNTLPEPYRSQLKELIPQERLNDHAESAKDIVEGYIVWAATKQGHIYWSKLFKSL